MQYGPEDPSPENLAAARSVSWPEVLEARRQAALVPAPDAEEAEPAAPASDQPPAPSGYFSAEQVQAFVDTAVADALAKATPPTPPTGDQGGQ